MVTHNVEFHAVAADRWDDLAHLFEGRGGPHYCWCMAWRPQPAETKRLRCKARNAALKAQLHDRVAAGTPIGLLAYVDGDPVAWCSVAPRATYRSLGGPDDDPAGTVWSIACFFVKREFRGHGMTGRLIAEAVRHARDRGATAVEAYPVNPDSPSYRFMGIVGAFEEAGFKKVGTAGSRRHVMRLAL
ncbi:MAG: GNAT family N-acetyltransferase [Minwuiales bacterium]|nr:GNAT family N-acetyltransferase [Minwuiales bacterium]